MKYISCRRNIFRLLERGKWKQNKVLPTGFSPNYSQWGATQLKLPFREKKKEDRAQKWYCHNTAAEEKQIELENSKGKVIY